MSDWQAPKALSLAIIEGSGAEPQPPTLLEAFWCKWNSFLNSVNTIFNSLGAHCGPAACGPIVIVPFGNSRRLCHDVSNYRPISLTSSCCKVVKSIIHDSLIDYLLDNNLIFDNQHGFIRTRSTLTNWLNSLHHWITSLDSKKSTDIIYIDFEKAFDSISHSKLIVELKSYGLRGKLISWSIA